MDHSHHHHHHGAAETAEALTGAQCKLHMLWNTQVIDTCVVFREWHIRSQAGFLYALVIITALGVLYEYLRIVQANYDRKVAARLSVAKAPISPIQPRVLSKVPLAQRATRAALYGASVFLSFFLMLVFMTYNAYLIGAVVVGAALGHYIFGGEMDTDSVLAGGSAPKGASCH
ncbi:Ctr copper transporter [Auricularia subglabra TFB-10046 SS5]|nr:Ctr copper transporter [Auricularia subglabra TFB-10046 SS5]